VAQVGSAWLVCWERARTTEVVENMQEELRWGLKGVCQQQCDWEGEVSVQIQPKTGTCCLAGVPLL